jgi:hypothetical protein
MQRIPPDPQPTGQMPLDEANHDSAVFPNAISSRIAISGADRGMPVDNLRQRFARYVEGFGGARKMQP